ncbi:MFS general substrate transporter [Rozella allomycis CSF55]|uniref:Lysosomal dipeptide transporter MFSD1 n=1 Tax=Rozella allomycis (strain CSF55) TaxID=988480 RepID=A0A4P9YNE3_ROZAC|nr:MFS general substrate transporter [Rozella allomycis CSF55]
MGTEYPFYNSLMYTIYSFPNIVLPWAAGIMLDKAGGDKWVYVFASLIGIGQFCVSLGIFIKSVVFILIGRLIFGLGGESLSVAQSNWIMTLFDSKTSTFAMGIYLSIGRFGTILNNILNALIAENIGIEYCAFIASILSFTSMTFAFYIQKRFDKNAELLSKKKGPFTAMAANYLEKTWYKDDAVLAGWMIAYPDILAILISPIAGRLTDRYQMNFSVLVVSGVAMTTAYTLLWYGFHPLVLRNPKVKIYHEIPSNSTPSFVNESTSMLLSRKEEVEIKLE